MYSVFLSSFLQSILSLSLSLLHTLWRSTLLCNEYRYHILLRTLTRLRKKESEAKRGHISVSLSLSEFSVAYSLSACLHLSHSLSLYVLFLLLLFLCFCLCFFLSFSFRVLRKDSRDLIVSNRCRWHRIRIDLFHLVSLNLANHDPIQLRLCLRYRSVHLSTKSFLHIRNCAPFRTDEEEGDQYPMT